MSGSSTQQPQTPREVEVLIVGAGFSGLGMGIQLRRRGHESFAVIERADDVGGSWRDNTYPGVACDVPSPLYSYSFRINTEWSRMYSPGGEIWDYLRDAAREEGIEPHLVLSADMIEAKWDVTTGRWFVHTSNGDFVSEILVSATGHLTDVKFPDVPGLDTFAGSLFHSARWDHGTPLDGRRVGVVGTGASALQIIPELAEVASEVVVFQRSAPYVRPRQDRVFSESEKQLFRRDETTVREMREVLFWGGDYSFAARRLLPSFLEEARTMALRHLENQVPDPELRAKLTPHYEIGCKRILSSDVYYPAMTLPHVRLETSALAVVDGTKAVSTTGNAYELDVLVFATGFETYDLPSSHRIVGRGGQTLAAHWGDNGMQAYDSVAVAGFPNFFMLNGPGTSLGHNSLVYMIETQVDHVMGALDWWRAGGRPPLEVSQDSEEAFGRELDRRAAGTVLLQGGCSSWYLDPRNGRATLSWPDFAHRFRDECATFDPAVYLPAAVPVGE
ncbi:NAD(P)/FAD-dependent oxidoreductase [Streptomyces sp. NPDC004237]|uniref:flavin-containing monooxygenase n=1 Tax=Streptomyces sp. NPDC004237 TaxID=3154455 RepID=UPI0033B19001